MFVNSDFDELLSLFNGFDVHYLIIGGYAVIQHGEPRYTKDLDLWVSTDLQNAASVYAALAAFGAPLADITVETFAQDGYFYQMGVPPVRVDVLMGVPGMTFAEAWPKRLEVAFDNLLVPFIGKEDLVTIKRAAGRPQDLIDAKLLETLGEKDD